MQLKGQSKAEVEKEISKLKIDRSKKTDLIREDLDTYQQQSKQSSLNIQELKRKIMKVKDQLDNREKKISAAKNVLQFSLANQMEPIKIVNMLALRSPSHVPKSKSIAL